LGSFFFKCSSRNISWATYFFHGTNYVLIMTNTGLGCIMGDFFIKSSCLLVKVPTLTVMDSTKDSKWYLIFVWYQLHTYYVCMYVCMKLFWCIVGGIRVIRFQWFERLIHDRGSTKVPTALILW
jgi:hypothetical protein